LTARGRAGGPPASALDIAAGTAIRPARDADQETQSGSLLGTPAFMPPEQAIGVVVRIDARSDVFSLGGILCAVLTGRPPYVADTAEAIRQLAARARLDSTHARLAACGAEPELVALCLRCLAPEPDERPRDAGEVAAAVAALRATAEERARRAELDRVREAEQGKRRRRLLAASGVVAMVLLAGLGVSLWQMVRAMGAEGRAKSNEAAANEERDLKAKALEAETKARQQAFAALRSMTAGVVERKFAQGAVLTDDDKAFLRGVIAQFNAFAAIQGDDADSRAAQAEGRFRVGRMRYWLDELKEAEADHDAALGIQKQLAADFPSRPEFRWELAASHHNRGNLLSATGQLKEAEADYDAALRVQKQLAAGFPNQSDLHNDLACTCTNLAFFHRLQGNWAAAKRLLLEGRPHHLATLKANPWNPTYRQFYRNHLKVLTEVHAGLMKKDEAVRTAEARRDLGWDPPADAYDAAGFLSGCIPIATKHQKLDDKQRKESAQFYTDAALKLLRAAVSKGYKDVAHMKKDTDVDRLRQRDGFQKLVAELEGKGK
jgi:hypothetical protein